MTENEFWVELEEMFRRHSRSAVADYVKVRDFVNVLSFWESFLSRSEEGD